MAELFQDKLEDKLLALTLEAVPTLAALLVGEPYKVPITWFPMAVVFTRRQEPSEDAGYSPQETLIEHWKYDCYLSIECLQPDTTTMRLDPATKRAVVPSYQDVKEYIEAVRLKLNAWMLRITETGNQVISNVGTEEEERSTYGLITSRNTGIEDRGDNYSQRAILELVIHTEKERP